DLSAGALGRVHDLARRRIEDAVIERLEPDPDILAVHFRFSRFVMPGLAPGIHDFDLLTKTWMAGTNPAMTPSVLLDDARHHAGADSAAALANGEAKFFFHRDRHDQVHFHRDVVARHHHLGAGRQMHDTGHVGGAEVELRTIVGEERGVTAALFLG